MLRFVVIFLLTLTLLVACRGDRSLSATSDWETGKATATLTVKTTQKAEPFIWWEAEKPIATNFPPSDRNPFAPANPNEAAVLSGDRWIGVDGKRTKTLFLEYTVQVPKTDTYFFYTRKFWHHGPFRWRWDDQPWQTIDKEIYLIDRSPMRQFVEANWVSLGRVDLAAGAHTLRVELTQPEGAAAFDCFVLTKTVLQARGKLKPNEFYSADVPDGFLFDPAPDPFKPSAIDLRSLNEAFAGEQGWIKTNGEDFVHGKTGEPVRFWAVNVGGAALSMDDAMMAAMARFLAKQGVNMVRVHTSFWSDDLRSTSPQLRDRLFAFVSALKKEGIYTNLSIYFPLWLNMKASYGFPGYNEEKPFALLFFNQEFQTLYRRWWNELLTTNNPYTGTPLRDDPAVAMVELVNEDSYFFWTFKPYETIPAPQMELLERQFVTWLTQKYGSVKDAIATWKDNQSIRGDEPANGRIGILSPGDLASQRESRRAQDTAAFLAESQQRFFEQTIAYLRQELDYKGLVYASNWITANAEVLGPLDKYTNTVADFMDRHGYFSSFHEGPHASYALSQGDQYEDQSALLFRDANNQQKVDLPIMDMRYNGKPSTISEVNWPTPNRFRADFPLLAAAYGSLQGTDGFFFFATNSPAWDAPLAKFGIASPAIMGQFPATAFIYRQGLIAPGESVVDISLKTDDIFALKGSPISAPQNLDEFRAKDIPPGQVLQSDRAQSIDPFSFLVGKVNVRFSDQTASAQQRELSNYIDRSAKTIRSSTDQLLWNYESGCVTVNAPQVQGATGFLRQVGAIALPDLQLTSDMDYGTVLLVALDNQPLSTSRRMLLQVMSEEQNFGWQTSGSPRKTIQNLGQYPLAVRNLAGTISLMRSDANSLTVTALDFNGYPAAKLDNAQTIKLQPQTFYYLIEK